MGKKHKSEKQKSSGKPRKDKAKKRPSNEKSGAANAGSFITGLLSGLVLAIIGVFWLEPMAKPRFEVHVNANGEPTEHSVDIVSNITNSAGNAVLLLEAKIRVRNVGWVSGQLSDCEIRPLGVLEFPVSSVGMAITPEVGPRQSGIATVQARVTVNRSQIDQALSFQIWCRNPDGSPAFGFNSVWLPREGLAN